MACFGDCPVEIVLGCRATLFESDCDGPGSTPVVSEVVDSCFDYTSYSGMSDGGVWVGSMESDVTSDWGPHSSSYSV